MRPVQNNPKRSRGRGRKPHSGGGGLGGGMSSGLGGGRNGGGNPNRTLDSNGPDIKIRGTVSHIYEKYQNLARDALSSGDYVGAENYLQHAEHYFRVLAANALQQAARDAVNGTRHANGQFDETASNQNQEGAVEMSERAAGQGAGELSEF